MIRKNEDSEMSGAQNGAQGRKGIHMLITLELVRDQWEACYPADRLAALYDRPHTALEVLTRTDGAWADVPDADRLWTVLHEGALELSTLQSFAADCADRAKKHAARYAQYAADARYAADAARYARYAAAELKAQMAWLVAELKKEQP
jgi:hypothetical protein